MIVRYLETLSNYCIHNLNVLLQAWHLNIALIWNKNGNTDLRKYIVVYVKLGYVLQSEVLCSDYFWQAICWKIRAIQFTIKGG